MLDVASISAANCSKKQGYLLSGGLVKIEAVLSIKKRAGFEMNFLVRAKEPRCELQSWIVTNPRENGFLRVNRFLV